VNWATVGTSQLGLDVNRAVLADVEEAVTDLLVQEARLLGEVNQRKEDRMVALLVLWLEVRGCVLDPDLVLVVGETVEVVHEGADDLATSASTST